MKPEYHYYTTGELRIRAQLEDDGYYHLYSYSLGYLDDYCRGQDNPKIKRFRSIKVGREITKKFLKWYINELKKELDEL